MADCTCVALPERALLSLQGEEAAGFLNALVSNSVIGLQPGQAAYTALLTPQGKFLHDFFVTPDPAGPGLLLDVTADRLPDLQRRLTLYRLRTKVGIQPVEHFRCFAVFGDVPSGLAGSPAFVDPRLPALGWRIWAPANAPPLEPVSDHTAYEAYRLALGVPDGARDIEVEKGILLENHFEALHGVDFRKGCYIGQELTARTKYRGLVKKQLHIVQTENGAVLPPAGTLVMLDGAEAGELRSSLNGTGLALLRLEAVAKAQSEGKKLEAGGLALRVRRPDYAGPPPDGGKA
ncbi:MAG: YgfZ/GcvT domain-containing protein [Ferrovibrio sp.]|uniref:CAF17-like 4Fe-4S cluster assembly/insertion protein YgfZ n=1 Tax=Ferrovibrio sp. TaxID=1917215 RepID=UPI00391DD3F1